MTGEPEDTYHSPSLYDLEYAELTEDFGWYRRLAEGCGGPLIELGCGNGRLTLALARSGFTVWGVDRSPAMLADFRHKLEREEPEVAARVHLRAGDFTRLGDVPDLPAVPLVLLPFNAIHHCVSHRDVLALLDGVRGLLGPDGRLGLDAYLPDLALYQRPVGRRYELRSFPDPDRPGEELRSWEESQYDALRQIHHVRYIYECVRTRVRRTLHIPLRVFYPQELRALLDWAGFEVTREACDFAGRPLHNRALKWVAVLKAAERG